MIFIFGFHSSEKKIYGHRRFCTYCTRETLFNAVRKKNYFDLFFIPIPIGSGKILDKCMVCGDTSMEPPYGENYNGST